MRRMLMMATLVAFAQTIVGLSTPVPQIPGAKIAPTARRIQVKPKTIAALPKGGNYVVDLTKPDVRYEFDPKTDLTRVEVRTDKGKVAISSWLEKILPAGELAGWVSRPFSIGTGPTGTGTLAPPTPSAKSWPGCKDGKCTCQGVAACSDMVYGTNSPCKFYTCDNSKPLTCRCLEGL